MKGNIMLNISNLIPSVIVAGYNVAATREAALQAIKEAGGEKQRYVRESFVVGYMAARLTDKEDTSDTIPLDLEQRAVLILNSKGARADKIKKGERRRTPKEEALYGAARKAWHVVLKTAEVVTVEKRGGARPKTPDASPTSTGTKPPVIPRHDNPQAIAAFLLQQATMLSAYIAKNVQNASIAERNAVGEFLESCKHFSQ